jgi:hypothetical protein
MMAIGPREPDDKEIALSAIAVNIIMVPSVIAMLFYNPPPGITIDVVLCTVGLVFMDVLVTMMFAVMIANCPP